MTDSSTTSRDFAPSWLRTSNHSPTPPFRALPTVGHKEKTTADDWDRLGSDRSKNPNGFRYQWSASTNGDNHNSGGNSENYFSSNNGSSHGRISDYDQDGVLRRSNSVSTSVRVAPFSTRSNRDVQQNLWNGRSKYDHHFRQSNGYAFRDGSTNSNGISYSFVTSKSLKSVPGATSPVLQQSDFPSLSPLKGEGTSTKSAQNTVWGNPPHLAKVMKRSLSSQAYLEGSGTILGPHYGKGFFNGSLNGEFKDVGDGDQECGMEKYSKNEEYTELSARAEGCASEGDASDTHQDSECRSERSENEEVCGWTISEVPRDERQMESSLLSSSGSTGSVESIDFHQSPLSGTTVMMVEDLLDETISEEEKVQIFHALEEIKERTGYGSYYERVALTESRHRGQRRYPFLSDYKGEEDEEDPDDRFLK